MNEKEKAYYLQIGHFVGTKIYGAKLTIEEFGNVDYERKDLLIILGKASASDYKKQLVDYLKNSKWETLQDVEEFDRFFSRVNPLFHSEDDEGLLGGLD